MIEFNPLQIEEIELWIDGDKWECEVSFNYYPESQGDHASYEILTLVLEGENITSRIPELEADIIEALEEIRNSND